MRTIKNVEDFAFVLKKDYGDCKGWSDLAIELLSERNIEEAKKILDEQLVINNASMPLNERAYVIKYMTRALCECNKFEEALTFFESYRGGLTSEYFNESLDRGCLNVLREVSLKMKCFDFYEKISIKYPGCATSQAEATFRLVEALLKEDFNKARDVFQQFDFSKINTISDDFDKKVMSDWYNGLSLKF